MQRGAAPICAFFGPKNSIFLAVQDNLIRWAMLPVPLAEKFHKEVLKSFPKGLKKNKFGDISMSYKY